MKKRLSNDVTSALYRDDQMLNNVSILLILNNERQKEYALFFQHYGQNGIINGSVYSNGYRNTPPPMQQQQIHEVPVMNYYSTEAGLGIGSDREIQPSPMSSINTQNDGHRPAPPQMAAWFDTDL
ncbi:unnamed protein product [Didymodactylos carnosus]|uniref:Uncharacterized protein n=1 Tax=Didymodactylos carnosus TaxID=1234261 RepID=A0A814EFX7_9BILA|nr:unnamed protein product [Didymodactylos carnosus]CAF3742017.1 unnamed protein product [Didymodactylos carnosus]